MLRPPMLTTNTQARECLFFLATSDVQARPAECAAAQILVRGEFVAIFGATVVRSNPAVLATTVPDPVYIGRDDLLAACTVASGVFSAELGCCGNGKDARGDKE